MSESSMLFNDDLVQRKESPQNYGVVFRSFRALYNENIPDVLVPNDPFFAPLLHGQVAVIFYPGQHREIGKESDYKLIDRSLSLGDIVKKRAEDAQSGVIIHAHVKARLAHAITGISLPGWIDSSEINPMFPATVGSFVVYKDWLGQIIEVLEDYLVELASGEIIRVPELGSRLQIGDKGIDVLPPGWHEDEFARSFHASPSDTVVHTCQTAFAISWLCINQQIPPEEATRQQRPGRFWSGPELNQLTIISKDDVNIGTGDKVLLRDSNFSESKDVVSTTHGRPGGRHGVFQVRAMTVKETQTSVRVLWQDGSEEDCDAVDLLQHHVSDPYECWPGDHCHWKNDGTSRYGIIQSINAEQRTARVTFLDDRSTDVVSALELDVAGPHSMQDITEDFGIHHGDYVLIHREGTDNGMLPPMVPVIGELEPWALEGPQMDSSGRLDGWRRNFICSVYNWRSYVEAKDWVVQVADRNHDRRIDWFGQVVSLRRDGLVDVSLPDGREVTIPIARISKLSPDLDIPDGTDMLIDNKDDDTMEFVLDATDAVMGWLPVDGSVHEMEWGDMDDDYQASYPSSPPLASTIEILQPDAQITSWEPDLKVPLLLPATLGSLPHDAGHKSLTQEKTATATDPESTGMTESDENGHKEHAGGVSEEDEEEPWSRFTVLSTAPADHAFLSVPPHQGTKLYATRLQKEYRALRSSLPDTILVRAYEDRSDLLRSMIIGPEGTPYENAPFVIDWLLESNFPKNPPKAHFHSWTQGHGRVNPNLYEEGKVCLSILGTWSGEQSESWNAARSSLLQALVSIQGLVLVKEPWYCEPGYDKFKGTEEGERNSRLYNEKAYILSQGFVRRALEHPPSGFEKDIHWYYHTQSVLAKVLRKARELIERSVSQVEAGASKSGSDIEVDAVGRLTEGGMMSLQRLLPKLQALLKDLLPC